MESTSPLEQQGNHMEESEKIGILVEELQNELERLKDRRNSLRIAKEHRDENPYFKKGTRHLAEFFYSKGFLIVDYGKDVGEHYQLGKQIYACLDVSWDFVSRLLASKEQEFRYEAGDISNEAFVNLHNLCIQMQKKDMLEFCLDDRAFFITSKLKGEHRKFLSGECYEAANRYLIEKAIRDFSKDIGFSVYRNVLLKRADSDDDKKNDVQLDFVVEFDDRFYIFETKAGMRMAIDKWVDRTRLFADEKNKFITCCLQDFDPKTFDPFILLPMKSLESDFRNLLEQEFQASRH